MSARQPPPNSADPARHSDQCLLDYARFGFCEHTTLTPGRSVNLIDTRPLYTPDPRPYVHTPPSTVDRSPTTRRPHPHLHPVRRELLRWVGFTCLLISTYLIATNPANSLFDTFLLITLPGVGWLIVLASGLPAPVRILMFTDFAKIIPRDARLDDPPPTRSRRRKKNKKNKKKGPSS